MADKGLTTLKLKRKRKRKPKTRINIGICQIPRKKNIQRTRNNDPKIVNLLKQLKISSSYITKKCSMSWDKN